MRNLFVVVPSLNPTGPIKGAVALVNALAGLREITFVHLKPGPGVDAPLDTRVRVVSLAQKKGPLKKLVAYRKLLLDAGGRDRVASLSLLFSADLLNLFCRRYAVTCASVRGNLPHIYRLDYGFLAIPLAMIHLVALRGFDHIVAMTGAMADQVRFYTWRQPTVIGNFVDEGPLEPYRRRTPGKGPLRFVFLGTLTQRKQTLVLLNALYELYLAGVAVRLDIIGDGPIRKQLEVEIARLGLGKLVILHGYLPVPYDVVAQADAFVLPSFFEGLSRAVLEALHLSVPCVLRDVDSNAELIQDGKNGALFKRDEELASAMHEVAVWSRNRENKMESLLPTAFRQVVAARDYLLLMEENRK